MYEYEKKRHYGRYLIAIVVMVAIGIYAIDFFDSKEAKVSEEESPFVSSIPNEYLQSTETPVKNVQEINAPQVDMEIAEGTPEGMETGEIDQVSETMKVDETEKSAIKGYIVTELENLIVIYSIDENGTRTLKEKTDTSLDTLLPQDQEIIRNGIEAGDIEELDAIIEGFSN